MSNRYKRIKIYKTFDFCPNSPVDILKGALYIDTKTNKVVFQLKFINMQNKKIKAVYINVKGFNELKEKLENKQYSYLDINASKGEEFGVNNLKELNDNTIREINISIDKVVFSDNSIWENRGEHIVTRKQLEIIQDDYCNIVNDKLNENESESDLRLNKYYYPIHEKDYWVCICGAYNSNQNKECYKCGLNKKETFKYFNKNSLKIELEKQEKIEEENRKQREEERKKTIKKLKIIIPIIIGIIIIIIVSWLIYNKINPSAKDILDEGDYVRYLDATGTIRECKVLYDFNSQYGLQIVTTEPVEDMAIGNKKSEDLAKQSYNNAIGSLNDKANEYKNTDFSTMARSIGSNPENPNKEGGYYSNFVGAPTKSEGYKGSDTNYETDSEQIEKIGISIDEKYWLASRDTRYEYNSYSTLASTISFYIRTSTDKELISRMSFDGWTVPFEKKAGIVPVFNIKDNIKIKNGDGTKNNPYILAE